MLAGAWWVASLAAQEPPRIQVAPTIMAPANSATALGIEVGPPGSIPPRSFLSVRGLPPAVALTDSHSIDPGAWAVPLASLPALKAIVPAGLSGQSEITITLIALDGRLLSRARTMLVIQGASGSVVLERSLAAPPAATSTGAPPAERRERAGPAAASPGPAPKPRERELSPADRERAMALLKKGEEMFVAGNVTAARLLYERAVDVGLAEAALALAATYDPEELARRQVLGGVQADPAAARRWYERAQALGAPEAAGALERIGAAGR